MLHVSEQDCFMVILDLQDCYISVMKSLDLLGIWFTGGAKNRHPIRLFYLKCFFNLFSIKMYHIRGIVVT